MSTQMAKSEEESVSNFPSNFWFLRQGGTTSSFPSKNQRHVSSPSPLLRKLVCFSLHLQPFPSKPNWRCRLPRSDAPYAHLKKWITGEAGYGFLVRNTGSTALTLSESPPLHYCSRKKIMGIFLPGPMNHSWLLILKKAAKPPSIPTYFSGSSGFRASRKKKCLDTLKDQLLGEIMKSPVPHPRAWKVLTIPSLNASYWWYIPNCLLSATQ